MPTEYVEDKEIQDTMTQILGRLHYTEFNLIREHEVKIDCCMKVVQDNQGENKPCKGDPVALKKVGDVEKLFMDTDYILVVNNSAWQEANQLQQEAIIHRGLMKINIDVGEKGIKITTRKPDIVEFTATAMRYGAYTDPLLGFRDALENAARSVAEKLQSE